MKCLQAQYEVLRRTAALDPAGKYSREIAGRLWNIIGGLAGYLDWQTADDAAKLAIHLAGISGLPKNGLFKTLCYASPHFAIRAREWLIRAVKPSFRAGYPGWKAASN